MLKLARKNVTPPGGFRYVDSDTNQKFSAPDMARLVKKVTVHRTSNKLPIPDDLPERIEDWLCGKMPAGICKDSRGRTVRYGAAHKTAESAVRATMLIHRIMQRASRSNVKTRVANARAAVCRDCSKNLPFAGCMSCRGVRSIIENLKRGRRTAHDDKLMACGICGVLNQIHVFIDEQTIIETTKKASGYPEHCWKLKIVKKGREHGSTNGRSERKNTAHGKGGRSRGPSYRTANVRKGRKGMDLKRVGPGSHKGGCCGGAGR
jgi:hypothetical protein